MVMEPVSIEEAIEKAKKKGLRPGRVKGTDGIQFTKGRNNRIEVITWDEFRSTLADRQLEVFDSNGFMIFMKRSEEHTSELQSLAYLVCRLLLEKKKHRQK